MKTLTLVRHAQAAPKSANVADFDRPLTRGGQAEANALARELLGRQVMPDLLLSSSAQRAKETTEILARGLGIPSERISYEECLYLGPPAKILRAAQSAAPQVGQLVIVGHNPGLSELAKSLAPRAGLTDLDTAAACSMTFDVQAWREISANKVVNVRC
jgi:phosphohistidine phosphatase